MPLIKSGDDIKKLHIAGRRLAEVLDIAKQAAKAGVTLLQLDTIIDKAIREREGTPSFLGFEGYPNASCLSINDQVVHGIPDEQILQSGMLLGIDVGLWYGKVCVDAALTVVIGESTPVINDLLICTQEALHAGIKAAQPFRRVGAISEAIQQVGERQGYGIVRTLTGHGVGHQVHEDPAIPNIGKSNDGILLRPGMVLAIEPMFTLGSGEVTTEVDGWGVVTVDHSLAAHFEHTVLITERGNEVLTSI